MVYLLTVRLGVAQQYGADSDPAAVVGAAFGMQPQPM
jgi:hypothetical protein